MTEAGITCVLSQVKHLGFLRWHLVSSTLRWLLFILLHCHIYYLPSSAITEVQVMQYHSQSQHYFAQPGSISALALIRNMSSDKNESMILLIKNCIIGQLTMKKYIFKGSNEASNYWLQKLDGCVMERVALYLVLYLVSFL